jgi:hypothetical protein
MSKLFTGTFFRFVLGFIGILAISFVIIIATGYYDSNNKKGSENSAFIEVDSLAD